MTTRPRYSWNKNKSSELVLSLCSNFLYTDLIFLLYGFVCISSRGWIVEPIQPEAKNPILLHLFLRRILADWWMYNLYGTGTSYYKESPPPLAPHNGHIWWWWGGRGGEAVRRKLQYRCSWLFSTWAAIFCFKFYSILACLVYITQNVSNLNISCPGNGGRIK